MYRINTETGTVTRISDGKVVSPVSDPTDVDFLEFNEWANQGNNPEIDLENLKKHNQKELWEIIKLERERRKFSGVKVGQHWFHTDPDSRTQQLGLLTASAAGAIPAGYMWKTLTPGGGLFDPVYVEMTSELASNIFFHTMLHDGVFHAAGETHRAAMLQCEDPYSYNYKINWPLSFEDVEAEFKANNPEA